MYAPPSHGSSLYSYIAGAAILLHSQARVILIFAGNQRQPARPESGCCCVVQWKLKWGRPGQSPEGQCNVPGEKLSHRTFISLHAEKQNMTDNSSTAQCWWVYADVGAILFPTHPLASVSDDVCCALQSIWIRDTTICSDKVSCQGLVLRSSLARSSVNFLMQVTGAWSCERSATNCECQERSIPALFSADTGFEELGGAFIPLLNRILWIQV